VFLSYILPVKTRAPHHLCLLASADNVMTRLFLAGVYTVLFFSTLSTISWTLYHYPLFPLQTESLEWSNMWLTTTVVDYYGSTLCLCGVILATTDTWMSGLAWAAGCCLLGSPLCCLWILYQVAWMNRSLALSTGKSESITGENGQLLERQL
jgi:hypothetical protein